MSDINENDGFDAEVLLTAYALGEVDAAQRAEVEARLAVDEDARRVVEEIRATASLVAAEIGREGGAALTAEQRAKIAAKAGAAKPVFRMRRVHWIGAAAAAAAIIAATPWLATKREKEVARAGADGYEGLVAQTAGKIRVGGPGRNGGGGSVDTRNTIHRDQGEAGTDGSFSITTFANSTKGGGNVSTDTGSEIASRYLYGAGGGNGTAGLPGGRPTNPAGLDEMSNAQAELNKRLADYATQNERLRKELGIDSLGSELTIGDALKSVNSPTPIAGGKGGPGARAGGIAPPAKPGELSQPVAPTFNDPIDPATIMAENGIRLLTQIEAQTELLKHSASPELAAELRVNVIELKRLAGNDPRLLVRIDALRPAVLKALDVKLADGLFDQTATTESYPHVDDNPFRLVKDSPLSTFGVDVDTASYSNIRRFLASGQLPPPGAVRIEEMINYFPYDYAPPTDGRPFAVRVDVAGCPWRTEHRLVRVGIKGKVVEAAARPASNLVFLIDVSGSMNDPAKLPLLVASMKLMVEKLESRDRVAMVVYAGSSGLVLPSTPCTEKAAILAALDRLQAGGSTNGGAGIELAYATAVANKIDGGVNRVILATDGDFNVGVTDESSLVKMIEERAKSGVFLSVLGFGSGNYKDAQMEKLADRGNGNYAYVDTLKEGRKALVDQMSGTLVTIAKDVKLQIEFNPAQVGAYRLIGYENRVLAAEDFKDDRKDAGEIGAGHTVTALYEIVPPNQLTETAGVDPLKYQGGGGTGPRGISGVDAQSLELLTVKLRWKEPESDVSTPMEVAVTDQGMTYSSASPDFKFAASVAAFGMLLRGSPYRGQANLDAVLELATEGAANDPSGLRREFVELVGAARKLAGK